MSVLLATDQVELYRPGPADDHGWVAPGTTAEPYWCGAGNFQPATGASDPRAAEAGGHGPGAPATIATGTLYLPPDANPADGDTARVRGAAWVLSQVRLIPDPSGPAGPLACWVATGVVSGA